MDRSKGREASQLHRQEMGDGSQRRYNMGGFSSNHGGMRVQVGELVQGSLISVHTYTNSDTPYLISS